MGTDLDAELLAAANDQEFADVPLVVAPGVTPELAIAVTRVLQSHENRLRAAISFVRDYVPVPQPDPQPPRQAPDYISSTPLHRKDRAKLNPVTGRPVSDAAFRAGRYEAFIEQSATAGTSLSAL